MPRAVPTRKDPGRQARVPSRGEGRCGRLSGGWGAVAGARLRGGWLCGRLGLAAGNVDMMGLSGRSAVW